MGVIEVLFAIVLIILALILTCVVLLQEGNQKNLGSIEGAADTFLSKNKSRTVDAMLVRGTKFVAIGFFISVIVINMIMYFM